MTTRKPVSIADLENAMIDHLARRGETSDFIRGYLAAQQLSGWLRPGCPEWIRASSAIHYQTPPARKIDIIP